MAIDRSAGTEIIRSAQFEDVANTQQKLIIGVQHHIYTVLSVTAQCRSRTGTNGGWLGMTTFDAYAGTSGENFYFAQVHIDPEQTWVWNDKVSFNGYEPNWSGHSGQMTTAAEQDAIADQGGSVSQSLFFSTDDSGTKFDVTVTYIDQNNS
jgi:hypothetical protein